MTEMGAVVCWPVMVESCDCASKLVSQKADTGNHHPVQPTLVGTSSVPIADVQFNFVDFGSAAIALNRETACVEYP